MAKRGRRWFLKTALAFVSTSLAVLNMKPGLAQSCGNYFVYDPYDGCNPDFPSSCDGGGGGGGGEVYICWINGDSSC